MLEAFTEQRIDAGEAEIHLKTAGDGPPLLLLHGYPQTSVAWHEIAPRLADQFTVVIPDLRGYGDSRGPGDPDPVDYSNRAMAEDMVAVMEGLGFDRYRVAGHDRGARVGYRYALDHPDRVERLAVLDVTPTLEKAEGMDYQQAKRSFHWLFLAQPHPFPETLINHAPAVYLEYLLDTWAGSVDALDPAAVDEYRRCFRRYSVVRAGCEDYRAGLSIDLEHDRASRSAGELIECPLLVLWGDATETTPGDPIEVWKRWATSVSGQPIPCGHFLMEEAPDRTLRQLESFFE
jgi:haloacetate dehalogenase